MKHVPATTLFKMLLISGLVIITISWQPKQSKRSTATTQKSNDADTSKPGIRSDDETDFDMSELDEQMQQLKEEMKEIDFAKIESKVKASLDSIDFKKINLEIQRAMKSIDWNKINMEVNTSLKNAQLQIEKINTEQIKANLDQVKTQLEKQKLDIKINTEQMKEQLEKGMQQLRENLHQMKASFTAYKKLTDALQKDGLIDTAKGYSIKLKNGALFINGKRQPASVVEKYKTYMPSGKGNFTLKKDYDGDEDDEGEEL